jgi:deoxyhypusine synthase
MIPECALNAVLVNSKDEKINLPIVEGYDFNKGNSANDVMKSFTNTGFQATSFGKAIQIVNEMVRVQKY